MKTQSAFKSNEYLQIRSAFACDFFFLQDEKFGMLEIEDWNSTFVNQGAYYGLVVVFISPHIYFPPKAVLKLVLRWCGMITVPLPYKNNFFFFDRNSYDIMCERYWTASNLVFHFKILWSVKKQWSNLKFSIFLDKNCEIIIFIAVKTLIYFEGRIISHKFIYCLIQNQFFFNYDNLSFYRFLNELVLSNCFHPCLLKKAKK